jgi:hypothetical protein
MTENGHERRGARRVDARLSLSISGAEAAGTGAARLQTINISTSGAYIESDRFLEPMTKLALQLELPVVAGDGEEMALVACEGLVVRTTPEVETAGQKAYEIAVFFTHLEAGAAEVLERHIATLLHPAE